MLTLTRIHNSPRLLSVLLIVQGVLAAQICTPEGCVKGKSSSKILHTDSSSHNQLAPGTYPLYGGLNLEQSSLSAPLNQTTSRSGESTTLTYPPRPAVFDQTAYKGWTEGYSGLDWKAAEGWKSLYLPKDWYAVTGDGEVLWGPVANSGELPSGIKTTIKKASSSICDPPCSSNGLCITSPSAAATCQCKTGWAGAQCDQCAIGFFGSSCKACDTNCTICDGGLGGTGKCLGTAKDATAYGPACGCLHGACTASGDCTCSAGFFTNSTVSDKKCNTCVEGFSQTENGDCRSCPGGCSTCRLKEGTADTSICTSCRPNLNLNTADPARCVSRGACQDGQYWDNSTSACSSCSPACSTCSGPSSTDCLICSSPRINLEGKCVGLDSKGVCDSSLASIQGVFVANNAIGKCDACPSGCTACNIPSFSSISSFTSLQCTACADGYLLQAGTCVKQCTPGWFLPSSADKTGSCQQCSSTCAECQTTSTTCTRCPSPSTPVNSTTPATFALSDTCVSTCPSGSIGTNGTCTPCHPDCATCTSPSLSSCTACPPHLPILRSGRCLDHCPRSSFFDPSSKSCLGCDWTCASCSSSGDGACTSCADGYILSGGKCKSAYCDNSFVHGAGLCLVDLVDKEDRRWIAGVVVGLVVLLGGMGLVWFVRRQRRRRREDSEAFREAMEVRGPVAVREEVGMGLGPKLGRVFGVDRIFTTRSGYTEGDVKGTRSQGDKKRLRELLLPSNYARRHAHPTSPNTGIPLSQIKYQEATSNSRKSFVGGGRTSTYLNIPPPPYAPSSTSTSRPPSLAASIPPPHLSQPSSPTYSHTGTSTPVPSTKPYETARQNLLRTIKHHEDDIDLLSDTHDQSYFPMLDIPVLALPKRAWTAGKGEEEKEKGVSRPGAGSRTVDEEEVRRVSRMEDRLSALWPELGKGQRAGEGWV